MSGDLIEGTITPKLLERQSPGLIEKRRRAVGALPGVEEFSAASFGLGYANPTPLATLSTLKVSMKLAK